jgi:hypothetical protein
MNPYNGKKSKHRIQNRDDIHHKTQDGGEAFRNSRGKRAKHTARQEAKQEIKLEGHLKNLENHVTTVDLY